MLLEGDSKGVQKGIHAHLEKCDCIKYLGLVDPACGSGNFLTESFICVRRLENTVISMLHQGQIIMDIGNPIQVSINSFFGIEINNFAVTVARTALWIAESQMMKETENVVHTQLDFLPLKTAANIVEGNALRLDWESVVSKYEVNYIMGNPPFVGRRYRTPEQTEDIGQYFKYKDIDYVACWYKKAAEYIAGTDIEVAFVSTNSITQGEQVPALWTELQRFGTKINFAYRTFRWDSEAKVKAHVFCIIVGFSQRDRREKFLYITDTPTKVNRINGYLLDAPDVFITTSNFAPAKGAKS